MLGGRVSSVPNMSIKMSTSVCLNYCISSCELSAYSPLEFHTTRADTSAGWYTNGKKKTGITLLKYYMYMG